LATITQTEFGSSAHCICDIVTPFAMVVAGMTSALAEGASVAVARAATRPKNAR
jgi:hypothetical protein